ncbi:hypothetical protein MXB_2240 [Myxobolus squamalis]|nr:hypothetical protein MXB_2240 [Myxobolus squamalis]
MFLSSIIETFSKSTTNLSGYIGAFGVILGGTITLTSGVIMNKTKNRFNRQMGICINILCAVPLSIVLIIIARNSLENISTSCLFIFYLAFSPVYISVGCEILADITYPADANISSSIALIIGNLFGSIAARLLGTINLGFKYNVSIGLCVGLYLTSALLLLIKFGQNRSKVEKNLSN